MKKEKKTKEERVSVGRNLVPGHLPGVLSKLDRASSGPHFPASVFGDLASYTAWMLIVGMNIY